MSRRRSIAAGFLALGVLSAGLGACSSSNSGASATTTTRPPSFAALVGAANLLLRRGNLNAAEQLFSDAISAEPKNAVGYFDLGVVYQREGLRLPALREYRLALRQNPRYVPAIYNKATLYGVFNPPLAIYFYRSVIALQPDSPTAWLNLGLLEAETKATLRPALKALKEAVRLEPSLRARIPASLRAEMVTSN